MLINFDIDILSLEGEKVTTDIAVYVAVANIVNRSTKTTFDPIKKLEVAQTIARKKQIDLDTSDYDQVYKMIKETEGIDNLLIGGVLLSMKNQKSEFDNKKVV